MAGPAVARRGWYRSALIGVACMLHACATSPDAPSCTEASASVSCLLSLGDATLNKINGHFDWATGAPELALGHDAAGESATAWQLMSAALSRAQRIDDPKKRATALGEIVLAISNMGVSDAALPLLDRTAALAPAVEDAGKRADLAGKLLTGYSVHGDVQQAAANAFTLAKSTPTEDAFRGRTQREVAARLAAKGMFDDALAVIDQIDAAFTYYGAVARTDVALVAVRAGRDDLVADLLAHAAKIARAQDNGYFEAGILRDVGAVHYQMSQPKRADDFIEAALAAAGRAPKFQERARATSRIATRLADVGAQARTASAISQALVLARQEPSQLMRNYSLYEIAGSAAFSGDVKTAQLLVDELPEEAFGSASSLRAAAQRDLAWGQARRGDLDGALVTIRSIGAPRERVHAIGRIVRLLQSPEMAALPRYL